MTYRLGETPFTDLTHDEFMAMYGGNRDPSWSSESEEKTVGIRRGGGDGNLVCQDYPTRCVRCEFGKDDLLSINMSLLLLRKPELSLLYIFLSP
jgi:hypothetical protein